jgi:hypothetical protein
MNGAFLSESETIRITNTEFQTVSREDLKGNFDLEVDISTAEVDAQQANDLSFLLQTLGNTVDIGITLMILSEIARLKKLPELAEKIARFQPQPDPLAQELQRLQIEELKLKVMKLRSETDLLDAKVEETEAKTDTLNLEFIETETGTKHARDMEKQRGQAQGNMDLEVTKALLKPKKPEERGGDIEAAIGYSRVANAQDNDTNVRSAVPAAPPTPVATVPAIPEPTAGLLADQNEIGGAGLPIDPMADQLAGPGDVEPMPA